MKLCTYRTDEGLVPGVVQDEVVVDIRQAVGSILDLVVGGDAALERVRQVAGDRTAPRHALAGLVLAAPVPEPRRNVFCMGLNYLDHVAETSSLGARADAPARPVWFTKATTALCGPADDIRVEAALAHRLDWEAELVVVIGTGGRRIPADRALQHVFGYTCLNDVTARDVQGRDGGQWFMGKSLDAASPLGPWVLTADEVPDPQALEVTCRVNGVIKQQASTSQMIFDVPAALADLSAGLTVLPGDLVATGTPAGVGVGRTPPEFLTDGDVLVTEIEGLGRLENRVRIDDTADGSGS